MSWSSCGRRARLASFLVLVAAMVASVLSGVVAPAPAAADDDCPPGVICIDPTPSGIDPADVRVVSGYGNPAYSVRSDAQREGLLGLEGIAVDNILRKHGIVPTDADRVRVRLWARTEVRVELIALILAAGNKPAGARSGDENQALAWFADVQQRRNVAVAQAAQNEYERFAGRTAYQSGTYPANACSYVPPAPYAADYPGSAPRWVGCTPGARIPILDRGPYIPSADEFTKWGTAVVSARDFTPAATAMNTLLANSLIGLGASTLAVAPGAIAFAALPYPLFELLVLQIKPFALMLPKVALNAAPYFVEGAASTASTTAAPQATLAFGAGSVFAIAAVVIVALTIAITAILDAVTANNLGQTLKDRVTQAQTTAVDPVSVLQAAGGTASLVQAVEGLTLDPFLDRVTGDDAYVPAAGDGANVLRVSGTRGNPDPRRTTSFQYLTDSADGTSYATGEAQWSHGWWVDRSPGAPTLRKPTQELSMYLWDPSPRIQNGVATSRPIFSFPASVSTVQNKDGRLLFMVTSPASGVTPKPGSPCSDLALEGCWLTDWLPTIDGDAGRSQRVQMLANPVDDFTITAPSTAPQYQPVHLEARVPGRVFTTDYEGDPVTVTWSVTCPAAATCPGSLPAGPSLDLAGLDTAGGYTVTATATDAFGGTRSTSVSLGVSRAAPAVSVATPTVSTDRATPAVLAGTLRYEPSTTATVAVDWGDGSGIETVSPSGGTWRAAHSYARVGTYTARVFGVGGGLRSDPVTSTVTVGNAVPVLTFPADAQTPATWANLEPGQPISLKGTVTDSDADQALTVKVVWYDGTVQQVPVTRNGTDAASTFSLQYTPRRTTGIVLDPVSMPLLATVTAVDAAGAESAPRQFRGRVNDSPGRAFDDGYTDAAVGELSSVIGRYVDPNGTTGPLEFAVDWGDGSTTSPDHPYGTVRNAEVFTDAGFARIYDEHTYTRAGVYTVTVTVAPSLQFVTQYAQYSLVFHVFDKVNPLQFVRWVDPPVAGQTSTLEIGTSSPEGATIHVDWGPGPAASDGEGASDVTVAAGDQITRIDHVFAKPGPGYIVRGTVSVATNNEPDWFYLPEPIVANPPPPAPTLPILRGTAGSPVTLPLHYDDLGRDTHAVTVDWGDGSATDTTTLSRETPDRALTHTYAVDGIYRPTVTLVDTASNRVTGTGTAVIGDIPPTLGTPTVTPAAEGFSTTISATAVDIAGGPTRLRVDWGDGTSTTTDPATTSGPLTARHAYADNGLYSIAVSALDETDRASAARTVTAKVANSRPNVRVTAPTQVTEGSPLDVAIVVDDPGAADTGTVSVDWGDGTSSTDVSWGTGTRSLTVRHVYADDDPNGTLRDRKTITVKARDDEGMAGAPATTTTTVANVAPTVGTRLTDAAGRTLGDAGQVPIGGAVVARVRATDPGTTDVLTAVVTWGDGTTSTATLTGGGADVVHRYTRLGAAVVSVVVSDDDRGVTSADVGRAKVVSTTAVLAATAEALRTAANADPTGAAASRSAARMLVAPSGATVRAALAAGDVTTALRVLQAAVGAVGDARVAGAVFTVNGSAMDLALLARAVATTGAAGFDPAAVGQADAARAVTAGDAAADALDPATAVAAYRQAWITVQPPPQG